MDIELPKEKVGILIIDGDAAGLAALREVLGDEDCTVGVAHNVSDALRELATGSWTLVVANAATTGVSGALYITLRELASSPPTESGKARLRALFVIPEGHAAQMQALLEQDRMPYALRPFHLNDFIEKVSDLLLETESIAQPLRRVRQEAKAPADRPIGFHSTGRGGSAPKRGRETNMFAKRESYAMTEEEIAEYERQESVEAELRKKKKQHTQLG